MTREELITKLTPLAQEVFQKSDLVLTDNLCAANLATWTSLSFMQFLTAIETEFDGIVTDAYNAVADKTDVINTYMPTSTISPTSSSEETFILKSSILQSISAVKI